jgi:4-hydroxy-3-methylbut-2-enyl diphosphate reductase
MNGDVNKKPLNVLMAAPRGFCAGVDRAIQIVERALDIYGKPIYVRHEIVHNRYVVENLERRGAVFVDELDEIPDNARVIFSAHGVPKSVPAEANRRGLFFIDATCPLVSKVHMEAERHHRSGRHVLLIGHAGHPEVIGTMGQLPDGNISLVESAAAAKTVAPPNADNLAYVTQTTLSLDETADIIAILKARFPDIQGPHKKDICYATTNRQRAVQAIAAKCDTFFVIGAPNSSNSLRLVEVAKRAGSGDAHLVQRAADIDWPALAAVHTVGLSAGASAPEDLVIEVLDGFRERFDLSLEEVTVTEENVEFKLPAAVRSAVEAKAS